MKSEIAEWILKETFYHWDKEDINSHRIFQYKNIRFKVINYDDVMLITFIGTDEVKDIFHYLSVKKDIKELENEIMFDAFWNSYSDRRKVYPNGLKIVVSGFSYGGALAQEYYRFLNTFRIFEANNDSIYLLSVNGYRHLKKDYPIKGLYVYTDNDIISLLFGTIMNKENVLKISSPYEWYKFYKNHFYAQSFMIRHLYVAEQLF